MRPPEICPNCGAEVPGTATACPECGSDYETGWSEQADSQRLDLPDEKFDYQEFLKEEFGGEDRATRNLQWIWWLVAAVLVLVLLAYFF